MVKQQNKFLILILCFLHKMRFTVAYFSDMHRCLQLQKSAHPKKHVPLSCLWEKELRVQFCWVFKTLLYTRKRITTVLSYSNNLPFSDWVLSVTRSLLYVTEWSSYWRNNSQNQWIQIGSSPGQTFFLKQLRRRSN